AVLSRDFVTAARLYKQLLKTDPSNVDYLRELGSIYVKNGEDSKAIPYYEQIITFYPHYVEAMNSLGAIYRRLKRYEDSIEILQRALEEDRQTGSVNYNLGFTYKEMGNYDDAIEAFEIVIAENPSDVLAYNHLGKIYFERKEYQKSINSYKRGLGVDKNHPILNYNLALCYDAAKMYPEAIRCFETALKSKPGWLDAIKDFSSLLIKCQQTKEAADIVKHSIELHPNDVKLLCLLGEIYLADFDYDSATKTFKRAKSIDANNIKVLSGLAESLEKDEKALDALEPISKAIEVSPDDLNLKKQYAYILLSAKEYDAALYNINELKEEAGENDLQVLDLYEQYYTCIGDEQKAQEYSDRIVKINKHYKNHILSVAKRYSQIGNQEKAETKAKEFIAREIRNPEGYNLLGKIYEDAGDLQSAIDTYNKSISIKIPNVHASRQLAKLNASIEVPPVTENVLPEEREAVTEAEETQEVAESEIPEEVAEEAVEEEEFDFEQMGGNIPMEEALVEEENPFFEDMENLDKEIEAQNEEIVDNSSGPSADDFYSSAAGEGYAQNDMSGNGAAQNGTAQGVGGMSQNGMAQNGMSQYPSYSEAEAQMQRNIQDAVMKSSNYAMEAAMTAQRMASEIAAEQATIKDKLKSIEEQRPYIPVAQESFIPNPIATEPEPAFEEVTDTVADEEPFETIDDLSNDLLGESLSEDETNALLGAPDQLYDENRKPLSDASGLLPTIEKIISDDDLASENAEKVDLFKKLLSMSEYLPEDEKEDFLSGKPRMQMEYLVAKLSGRPGLLKTAKSLIKSGVLGEEYSLPEEESLSEKEVYDKGISNNLIRSVIKTMERLSINLDDKYLSRALCVFADNVLEQIEIQESKVRIF
ncbi:MAG: tetratricopeptide repeat protein, partial [Treponema sp.]|nr:tetratricopeptide repeat protein [Treponema sp.]